MWGGVGWGGGWGGVGGGVGCLFWNHVASQCLPIMAAHLDREPRKVAGGHEKGSLIKIHAHMDRNQTSDFPCSRRRRRRLSLWSKRIGSWGLR